MKKTLQYSLIVSLFFVLTACGSEQKDSENNDSKTEQANNTSDSKTEVEKPVIEEPEELSIEIGVPLVIEDYAEITIQANNFGKTVNPPNPGSFYTYYENKENNETYFDTIITIKSLLTSQKTSDEFVSVKVVYDDKYEYTTFSTIEDQGGSDLTYTNITAIEPLKSGTLHFLASLPTEIESDDKPLKVILTVNGEDYVQTIR